MNDFQSQQFRQSVLVFSQAVAALAEIEGMKAENMQRAAVGSSMAYGEEAFYKVIDKYSIHWNGVIEELNRGVY